MSQTPRREPQAPAELRARRPPPLPSPDCASKRPATPPARHGRPGSVGPTPREELTMYARVARWEGAAPEDVRASAQGINAEAAAGPPEGLPAEGLLLLI